MGASCRNLTIKKKKKSVSLCWSPRFSPFPIVHICQRCECARRAREHNHRKNCIPSVASDKNSCMWLINAIKWTQHILTEKFIAAKINYTSQCLHSSHCTRTYESVCSRFCFFFLSSNPRLFMEPQKSLNGIERIEEKFIVFGAPSRIFFSLPDNRRVHRMACARYAHTYSHSHALRNQTANTKTTYMNQTHSKFVRDFLQRKLQIDWTENGAKEKLHLFWFA